MAGERGYLLSPKTAEAVRQLARDEGGVRRGPGAPVFGAAPVLAVKVTNYLGGEWYEGEIQVPDQFAHWEADDSCIIRNATPGAHLQLGAVYPALRVGQDSNTDRSAFAALDLEALVKVKSPTPDPASGLYDACLVIWNDTTKSWDDGPSVWVQDLNP